MTVYAVVRDLILASRILEAGRHADVDIVRVDSPADLPSADQADLVLVDWGDRRPGWADELSTWRTAVAEVRPRVVLFGPHTDLTAHDEARRAGLGPLWARSKLVAVLPTLMRSIYAA